MQQDFERDVIDPELTMPARPNAVIDEPEDEPAVEVNADAPWLLQLYFDGEVNLDVELSARYPAMPVMSIFHQRTIGQTHKRGVASLSTQDGSSNVLVEVDAATRDIHVTAINTSMLSLGFHLDGLSDMDRSRWMDVMRGSDDELAFLWGQARWESDYLVCAPHKYYTNVYAFSPSHIEAAFRLTPDVSKKLIDWLQLFWSGGERSSRLNTW